MSDELNNKLVERLRKTYVDFTTSKDLNHAGRVKLACYMGERMGTVISIIDALRAELALQQGANQADQERMISAASKAGVMYSGCDTPDMLADEVVRLRADEAVNQDTIATNASIIERLQGELALATDTALSQCLAFAKQFRELMDTRLSGMR